MPDLPHAEVHHGGVLMLKELLRDGRLQVDGDLSIYYVLKKLIEEADELKIPYEQDVKHVSYKPGEYFEGSVLHVHITVYIPELIVAGRTFDLTEAEDHSCIYVDEEV